MTEQAPQVEGQAQVAPDTAGQAKWYDTAPDEVKGYIQNKGWDDPIKAVNSYQELEKFKGASEDQLLKLPKDPNAEGAFDAIYDKLGRPVAPDKYEIKLPEGVQVDEQRLNGAREIAHKLGLNQKQFEELAKFDAEYYSTSLKAMQEQNAQKQEADYQALVKEWGSNASEREELSRRGLRSVLPQGSNAEELTAAIEQAIGTANTLKLFANVGEKLSREDRINEPNGAKPFGYTAEQAKADRKTLMAELQADPVRLKAYNEGKGTDIEKMQRLNKIIAS